MPRASDTRIIQMQFDNKDFERNIKTSEKSLSRFKEALDFSKCERGLDNLSTATRSISFDALTNNIQKLTDKFTGLGTASELVLSQIRRGIEETARKISGLVDSLAFDTIGEGKDKFEQMNKNVQTIMSATGESEAKVYKVMARLNKYTDQTSYNFTDMAANIGKFTSVGIPLEKAEKEMEGIANWAARSGAGITETSRAMYNLSQAMGVGKMLRKDWMSIENAGMATKRFKNELIESGVAAGKLEKVVDAKTGNVIYKTSKEFGKQIEVNFMNLGDTLSKGWATREVLEKTLARYHYEDLEYEGKNLIQLSEEQRDQIEKIFTEDHLHIDKNDWGLIESLGAATDEVREKAIKAAIEEKKIVEVGEKGGKKLYKTAKQFGKEITFTLDSIGESLSTGWFDERLAEQIGLIGGLSEASYEAAQKCLTLKDVFQAWKDQLSTGWMKFWQKIFGGLTESMELFSAICNKVGDSFTEFIRVLVGDGENVQGIFGEWENLGGRDSLWSLFLGEYDGLYEGAYGLLDVIHDVSGLISQAFWDLLYTLNADSLQNKMSRENWLVNEDYRNWFMGNQLKQFTDDIRNFIQTIRDFFNEAPENGGKTRWQQIQDVVTGLSSVVGIAWMSIQDIIGFAGTVSELLAPAFDIILEVFSSFGIELRKTGEEVSRGKGLKAFFDELLPIIQPLTDAINRFAKTIGEVILKLIGADEEGSKTIGFWSSFSKLLLKVAKVVTKVATPIIDFLTDVFSIANEVFTNGVNTESINAFGERVKGALKKMFDSIFSFSPNFSSKIATIWRDLKDVFKSGFSKKSIKKLSSDFNVLFSDFKKRVPTTVKDATKNIYNNLKTFASEIWNKIKAFFSPFYHDVKKVFTSGFSADSLKSLKERFSTIFETISNYIPDTLKEKFNNVVKKVKTHLSKIVKKIKEKITKITGIKFEAPKEGSVFDKVIKWFKEKYEKLQSFVTDLFGGGDAKESGKKDTVIERITNYVSNIINAGDDSVDTSKKSIFDRLIEWLDDKVSKVRAYIQKLVGNQEGDEATLSTALSKIDLSKILLIMIGVLGIAGIIKLAKKVWSTIKTVADITKTIAGIPKQINEAIHGPAKVETKAEKILKIAIAIGIVAAAIIFIGQMRLGDVIKGLLSVTLIGVGLVTMVKILNKEFKNVTNTSGIMAGLASMLVFALSVAFIVSALKPLSQLTNFGQFASMFGGLIIIIGSFALIGLMLTRVKYKFKDMAGLLAMAAAIWLLVRALLPLKDISDPAQWARMGGALFTILGMLFAFTYAINKFSGGVAGLSGMGQLAAVVGAIALLVFALLPIALVPWPNIIRMIGFLGLVLFEFVGFIFLVSAISKVGTMAETGMIQLAAVALAIAILMAALLPIALMNDAEAERMASTLGKIMFILAAFIAGISAVNHFMGGALKGTGMAQLLAVAGSIVLLVLSMLPLALLRPEQLTQALGGVITLMMSLLLFVALANRYGGSIKGFGIAQVLAVAGAVILLVIALIPLSLMEFGQLAAAVGSVVLLLAALALVVVALSKLKTSLAQSLGVIGILLMFAGIIYVFGLSMEKVKDMKWENMVGFSTALVILLLGLAAVILVLSTIKNPLAILGVMAAFAVGLAAVLLVVALCIPLIMNALSSGLESMMARLAIVAGLFESFASGMNNVSEDDLEAAKQKFEKLMEILILTKDAGDYMGGIKAFEMCMLMLGNAVSQFMYSTGDVEDPSTSNGLKFVKEMLALKEEFAAFSIGTFKTDIAELGEAIANFGTSTSSSSDQMEAGIKMVQDLAGEADHLDTLSKLPLDTLKTNIANLGSALKLYAVGASEAEGLQEGDVPDIQKAVGLIQSVMESLNADDGFGTLPDLPEESAIGDFGVELVTLATAMSDFSAASQNLGDTTEAIRLLGFLGDLRSNLTDNNIKVANIFGDNGIGLVSLTTFGLEISSLGTSLKRFADNTKDFTLNQNTKDALTFFASLKNQLTVPNLVSILAFGKAGVTPDVLTEFGTEIGELGEALSKFATNVNFDTKKEENFKAAIMALDDVSKIAKRLPTIGGLNDLLFGHTTTLGELGGNLAELGEGFSLFSNALEGKDGKFEFNHDLAMGAIDSLLSISDVIAVLNNIGVDSVQGSEWNITVAVAKLAEFLAALNTEIDSFESYGLTTATGGSTVATGLASMVTDFALAIQEFDNEYDISKGLAWFTAFRDMAAGIASLVNVDPSLDFSKVGEKIGSGIISGLNNQQEAVRDAILTLINLGELFGDSADTNPTIRPIVDLTNVTNGANALNSLFSNPYGFAVDSEGVMSIDLKKASLYAEGALPQNYTATLDGIKSEVGYMRSDLKDLASAMSKMKFVFHSGEVVAAIGPEMDEYLGRLGYYSVRGDIP